MLTDLTRTYGCTPSSLQTAFALVSDPQPHTRHQALQVLTAAGQQPSRSTAADNTALVDAIFQRLCAVVATDSVSRLRLSALDALAGLHHASTAVKLQALSKKATQRLLLTSKAAAKLQQQSSHKSQQPPAKKQKQQQQPEQGAEGLLDAATGAFVHGTEDDLPRVRLAAVAAVVSLSSQDPLFADSAALLLSDLVGDQLVEVRVAALQALVTQATTFQQHKQAQQQQQQQSGKAVGDAGVSDTDAATDADMEDADETERSATDSYDNKDATDAAGLNPELDSGAVSQPEESSQPQQQQHQHQQQQQARRSKPRKSDLPCWGRDALLAAAAALSDRDHIVRQLALQLLQQLPPGNVPDLVVLIQGVAACCERYPRENVGQIWALLGWLGRVRAEMITLAPGKLVPLLAGLLQAHPVPAAAAAGEGDRGIQGAAAGASQQSAATATAAAAAAAASAAAAVDVLGESVAASVAGLPVGAQALAALLLLGVQQRQQGVAFLLKELAKAHLMEVNVLQPWLGQVQAYLQQQQDTGANAS